MAKYDWVKLEREFTTIAKYATTSLIEFAKIKSIPYGENYRKHTNGWLSKRAEIREKKSRKIADKITEREVEREVALTERHIDLWNSLLDKVEGSLKDDTMMLIMRGDDNLNKALVNLAKILDTAQKGQRLALGMDKDKEKETKNNALVNAIMEAENEPDGKD